MVTWYKEWEIILGGFMGFKCPVCLKDFGHDKKAWEKHCKNKHLALGEDMVNTLDKITGSKIKHITQEEK